MSKQNAQTGVPFELSFAAEQKDANPYWDYQPQILLSGPDGQQSAIPLFWRGDRRFAARICPQNVGTYRYQMVDPADRHAFGPDSSGTFAVAAYSGANSLYIHGSIRSSPDRRHLSHNDGEPFFWLADTWWYGATRRCRWPEDFQQLVADRAAKGFSVVQMVVGIPPEIDADHPSVENEGGHPFLRRWDLVNPAYFDYVDRRIEALVEAGIVPCILGGWGYQVDWMGREAMQRYWHYLVARYCAFPVVWCLAGESDLLDLPIQSASPRNSALMGSLYRAGAKLPSPTRGWAKKTLQMLRHPGLDIQERREQRRKEWCVIGESISSIDPYEHLITTHPTADTTSHESLLDASWIGMTGIQSGHSEAARHSMASRILEIRRKHPPLPVVNLEPWYEGILGQFWAADQRFAFWSCLLAGAAGHSYGAHGLWQMAQDDAFLGHWGSANWHEAYQLPGAEQLGLGKRYLQTFAWWRLQPATDALSTSGSQTMPFLPAAISTEERICLIYAPTKIPTETMLFSLPVSFGPVRLVWWNPRTGEPTPVDDQASHLRFDMRLGLPAKPTEDDWLLVIREDVLSDSSASHG